MSKYKYNPMTPDDLQTYSLKSRPSKVDINDFAKCWSEEESFGKFINSLPDILAGRDFKDLVKLLKQARRKNRCIIFSMGAHVIKVGLNPLIIDLMQKKWISALGLNGAGIVHDFEIALIGKTSEDVKEQIRDGRFGMAQETGKMLNGAINLGADEEIGMGEAVGKMIYTSDLPYKHLSLLSNAYALNVPVTVHVAIGTDIIHFHSDVNGEALGKTSLRDFFLFCTLVRMLEGGGVYLNIGSAVVLPEVFIKAVTFVRNQGLILQDFSTAVFDFIQHYRPDQNVVKRPLGEKGQGFYFVGHHEIMLPLLAAALKAD